MNENQIICRMAYTDEWQDAMGLAWQVFMKFDAPDYDEHGIESFREFVTDETLHRMFLAGSYQVFLAFDKEKMVGIISLRDTTHISLLFVDGSYQRKGIGSKLIDVARNYILTEVGGDKLTVNASPYGIEFYHNRGFVDLSKEQTTDGIRYTPMVFYL